MTQPEMEQYESSAAFRAELSTLGGALQAMRRESRPDPRAMHELVRTCAIRARAHAMPAERLVRALKALVREVALDDASDAYRVLYTDRIIAWAIESYYELAPS
jgi:hypothetical protein